MGEKGIDHKIIVFPPQKISKFSKKRKIRDICIFCEVPLDYLNRLWLNKVVDDF